MEIDHHQTNHNGNVWRRKLKQVEVDHFQLFVDRSVYPVDMQPYQNLTGKEHSMIKCRIILFE